MNMPGLHIERDPLGSLVHVKNNRGECQGCIERALFEVVRELLRTEFLAEVRAVLEKAK